jgi:hypothetical protein
MTLYDLFHVRISGWIPTNFTRLKRGDHVDKLIYHIRTKM